MVYNQVITQKQAVWLPCSADTVWPHLPLTRPLTLKLVCKSQLRWGTFLPNLGSRIIRYVRNGRTDGRTDGQKQRLLPPSPWSGESQSKQQLLKHINVCETNSGQPHWPITQHVSTRYLSSSVQRCAKYASSDFISCTHINAQTYKENKEC